VAIISIVCPHCKTRLKASDQMVGGEAQCPECANMIVVRPEPAAGGESIYDLAASSIVDAVPPETPADPDDLSHLLPVMLEREEPLRTTGPHVYLNISGWEFTAGKLLALFLVIALIGAALAMWMLTPGERAHLVGLQPVRTQIALASVQTLQPEIDGQPPVYTIGGRERLILAQSDPDGDHLLIELDIPRRMLLRHAASDTTGTTLRHNIFVLEGGNAPSQGWIVARRLDHQRAAFDLARASTRSGWSILPTEIKPTQELPTGPDSATLAYEDESLAMGVVRFRPKHASTQSPGLHARGNVRHILNNETALLYDYTGNELTITWSQPLQGLHSVEQDLLPRASRLPDRVSVTLLLPRPKRGPTQSLTLRLGNETILTLDASAGREP